MRKRDKKLEIAQTDRAGMIVFVLKGDLTSGTVSKLNDVIDKLSDIEGGIELDCTELTSVSGAGFEALLRLTKMVRAFGKKCVLTNVTEAVYDNFNTTGLVDILTIERIKDGV